MSVGRTGRGGRGIIPPPQTPSLLRSQAQLVPGQTNIGLRLGLKVLEEGGIGLGRGEKGRYLTEVSELDKN